MRVTFFLFIGIAASSAPVRAEALPAALQYTVRIDTADLSSIAVEMRVGNAPDTFRVAMATHPEYDDRYWRYVESLHVESRIGGAGTMRLDSALWLIRAPGGNAVIRYRIHLPPTVRAPRAAWRPFLTPEGGLTGGIQTFMYIVGESLAPARVILELPAGWGTASELEETTDPRTFFARDAAALLDAPILVGHLQFRPFAVNGVPHRIAYLPVSGSLPLDTEVLAAGLSRLVTEAGRLFGGFPYRAYTFLLEEGSAGALEHLNSVTVGVSGGAFIRDPRALYAGLAHEYFHAWNLTRLRPEGFGEITYAPASPSPGLWWSEGITMMYADVLLRRAGLPTYDSTRLAHLEAVIEHYAGNAGNSLFSPEQVSLVAFESAPGRLGDYSASTHVQGELLGTMIDLTIRNATGGRRSIDDLMRAMFARFSGAKGFTGRNIEETASEVSGRDMREFFETNVRTAGNIDFNRYLTLIGLRMELAFIPARDTAGLPEPDRRVFAWQPPGERFPAVGITDPTTCWGKAGLHTGDVVTAAGGKPVVSAADLRSVFRSLQTGDTLAIEVLHNGSPFRTVVYVTGYDRPQATIREIPEATPEQKELLRKWRACAP